jgi:mRNA interferase HigB
MRLIKRKTFIEFGERHANAKTSALHLARLIEQAEWRSPFDVAQSVSKSKVVTNDRVRFEISGGNFRAIVAFDWVKQIAFIKFIGTHGEYDRIDATNVSEF